MLCSIAVRDEARASQELRQTSGKKMAPLLLSHLTLQSEVL